MKQLVNILAYPFILVMLIQIVHAGEVFNDEVKDNVPFYIDSIKHIARYYPSAKKVSILAGTDRVLVAVEDCKNLNKYKYCLDSAVDGVDDETGDPSSTMDLRVIESGPEISIDRSVSKDEPMLNEEVEVTAIITNNGNERANNVNYEDNFPSSVKVTGAYFNMIKNGAFWAGSLEAGKSQQVKYKIKFTDFIDYNSTAQASYIHNNKVNKLKSDTVLFEVQTPYKITESMSAKSVSIGEEITYTFDINNTDASQSLKAYVDITLPKGVTVSYRDIGIDMESGAAVYSGSISSGSSETKKIKFKASKVVQGTVNIKFKLIASGTTFTKEFSHKIGVGVSDIFPEITFEPSSVKSGHELEIEARIVNNGDNNVTEISLNLASDLIDMGGWKHLALAPGKKHYAFNKIISAPSVEEETDYFIKLSGSYTTKSGKTMDFESKEEVTILPQAKLAELIPTVVVDRKEVNVTLKIKNIASHKLTYVSLIDTFPKGFRSTAGSRDIDIDELAIGEERTAYSYIIKVPDTYTKDSFEVTHIFNGLDKDEEKVSLEKKTKVSLGKSTKSTGKETAGTTNASTATANKTVNKTGNVTAEADESEEKPGVFKRMWSWIKGLFSKEPADKFE